MKKIFVILLVVALMSCVALPVLADTPDEGTLNSAALSYFTGAVNKLPPNCDYVIYRSGDYSACLVYSYDMILSGKTFSAPSSTKIVYDSRGTGSGASYTPKLTVSDISNFTLTTSDNHILYSSLGSYASVGDSNRDTFTYILWSIVILVLLFIVFKFFRNRRHYINI